MMYFGPEPTPCPYPDQPCILLNRIESATLQDKSLLRAGEREKVKRQLNKMKKDKRCSTVYFLGGGKYQG